MGSALDTPMCHAKSCISNILKVHISTTREALEVFPEYLSKPIHSQKQYWQL